MNEKIPVLGYRSNRNNLNLFETNIFLEDVVNDAANKNLHTKCQNSWNSTIFPEIDPREKNAGNSVLAFSARL